MRIEVVRRLSGFELIEEASVAFEEEANIGDAVKEHGDAFDADAKGPSARDFGVDVPGFEDVGIDHAGAQDLDPAAAFAKPPTFLSAADAGDIDFDARLSEGEKAGTESDLRIFSEEGLREELQDAAKVREIEALFDVETFDLMKHGGGGDVVIAAIDGAGRDDADGRLVVDHRADLNGASVRTKQGAIFEHEGILHVACGVIGGEVEGLEVEVVPLGLRAFGDFKAHGEKDVFDLALSFLEDVFGAPGGNASRQGEVFAAVLEVGHELSLLKFFFGFSKFRFEGVACLVDEGAQFRSFVRAEFAHVLHIRLNFTLFAEIFFLKRHERRFVIRICNGLKTAIEKLLKFGPDEIGHLKNPGERGP